MIFCPGNQGDANFWIIVQNMSFLQHCVPKIGYIIYSVP